MRPAELVIGCLLRHLWPTRLLLMASSKSKRPAYQKIAGRTSRCGVISGS